MSGAQAAQVVLLVEDEELLRFVLAEVLNDAGFEVVEAGSADEALALIDSRPEIGVLWADIQTPGALNGLELAHIAHQRRASMAILLNSGRPLSQLGSLPEGARFLSKPYTAAMAVAALEHLLGEAE